MPHPIYSTIINQKFGTQYPVPRTSSQYPCSTIFGTGLKTLDKVPKVSTINRLAPNILFIDSIIGIRIEYIRSGCVFRCHSSMGCCSTKDQDTVDAKDIEIRNTTAFNCKEYLQLNCNCKVKVQSSVPADNSEYTVFLFYFR